MMQSAMTSLSFRLRRQERGGVTMRDTIQVCEMQYGSNVRPPIFSVGSPLGITNQAGGKSSAKLYYIGLYNTSRYNMVDPRAKAGPFRHC